jgi:hypothetical protein
MCVSWSTCERRSASWARSDVAQRRMRGHGPQSVPTACFTLAVGETVMPIHGARLFLPAGHSLCGESRYLRIRWAGFRPLDRPRRMMSPGAPKCRTRS